MVVVDLCAWSFDIFIQARNQICGKESSLRSLVDSFDEGDFETIVRCFTFAIWSR